MTKRRVRRTAVSAGPRRSRYRWAVLAYDRRYRFLHGLDTAASEVGSAGRIAVRRSHRTLQLAGGTTIRFGDRIAIPYRNNATTIFFHQGLARLGVAPADGAPPRLVAAYQRALLASLHRQGRSACEGHKFFESRDPDLNATDRPGRSR